MKKSAQRQFINDRLQAALEDLYHNATPHHPCSYIPEDQADLYDEWFAEAASFEVEHINGGGAHGLNATLIPSYCRSSFVPTEMEGKSSRVLSYWRRFRHRAALREVNQYARHERIIEYGTLYTYGRGGRTLAPDRLIRHRGGSSFAVKDATESDSSLEDRIDMILTLEAFNASVKKWNSAANLKERWLDFYSANFDEEHTDDGE